MAEWIWLDENKYPDLQKTNYCSFMDKPISDAYCVADFEKTCTFKKPVSRVTLNVTGSSSYRLYADGQVVGTGPAAAGGDFLCQRQMPVQYTDTYTLRTSGSSLRLYAEVQLKPVVLTDYSVGRGGLYIDGAIEYADGSIEPIATGSDWSARLDRRFTAPYEWDGPAGAGEWENAATVNCTANLKAAPIPPMEYGKVEPLSGGRINVPAGETVTARVEFDMIYAGYILLDVTGEIDCEVSCFEKKDLRGHPEKLSFGGSSVYRSYQMHSIGGYMIKAVNRGDRDAVIKPALVSVCYPVTDEGRFSCSDRELNTVYDVCKWTLRNCRQTLHLDSPMHQEPLACTGDYYIETLMTAFTFGDMRLARLDAVRTADWLRDNDGRMFHTSYSLIWVQMLYTVYLYTADRLLLAETEDALIMLLNRFAGYIGETGLIENAPDYMFVDWTEYAGYSMHHPPKALGQTPLNAFYHGALVTAARIFDILGNNAEAARCDSRAAALKSACRKYLFDVEKCMFFDGLTTPVTGVYYYLPENADIKRFSKYGNTLAVLYGLSDGPEAAGIITHVVTDDSLGDVQPYFTHFILEALSVTGLFEKYGLDLISRWKTMTNDCAKGLKEGWFAPQKDYSFDYSHAWGGTPAYQLPAKLLGFRMVKPGFEEISLSPKPMGLGNVEISMPTPYGFIRCKMGAGKTELYVPNEIKYTVY